MISNNNYCAVKCVHIILTQENSLSPLSYNSVDDSYLYERESVSASVSHQVNPLAQCEMFHWLQLIW